MSNQADFYIWQQTIIDEARDSIETQLPATVLFYDHTRRMATVKILSLPEYDTMCYRDIPPCQEIPVATLCSGGFLIHSPLKAGDTGYVSFFSKEIDEYKNTGGEHLVDGCSSFDYHNVIFHPTLHPFNKEILGTHENNLTIGSQDGSLTLEMTPDKEILINQNGIQRLKLNSDGSIDILSTKINVTAPEINMDTANLNVTGDINTTGTVSASNVNCSGMVKTSKITSEVSNILDIKLIFNAHEHVGNLGASTSQPITPMI